LAPENGGTAAQPPIDYLEASAGGNDFKNDDANRPLLGKG